MKNVFHYVARTHWPLRPFLNRDHCADLWATLQARFPLALAMVLMPEHLHLLLAALDEVRVQEELAQVLRGFTQRRFPGTSLWQPLPPPERCADLTHVQRTIRYILLNPSRRKLVKDPLQWEWSTHRDVMGAVARPWTSAERIGELWGMSPKLFLPRFHSFVSSDATVDVAGTPLPMFGKSPLVVPLSALAQSVVCAERAMSGQHRVDRSRERWLTTQLAHRLGGFRPEALAAELDCGRWALQRAVRQPVTATDLKSLRAAEQILRDPRLQFGWENWGSESREGERSAMGLWSPTALSRSG